MSVTLNNSKDLVANSVSIIQGDKVIDLLETINSVQGLAPSTLNSLEKLASALDNNPTFNESVMQGIDQKADTTYVNSQLATKANSSLLSNYYLKTETDNKLDLKADQTTTYTKSENDDKLNLKADKATTYTKSEVDTNFSNLIGSAPQALNTLQELASALSNDGNYATTVQNQLALKANVTDTYTKLDTDTKLNLKADKSDTYTKLDTDNKLSLKANATDTYTKTDTDTKLSLKADKTDTYTKTETDNKLNLKANLTDVLQKVVNGNEYIISLNSKTRIYYTSSGDFIIQYFDNDGTIVTDGWMNIAKFYFNTNNNRNIFYSDNITVAYDLVVNGINILNSLNSKVDISQALLKVVSGTETFINLDSNMRLRTGTDRSFKIQYYDVDGAFVTNTWVDMAKLYFDTEVNKSRLFCHYVSVASGLGVDYIGTYALNNITIGNSTEVQGSVIASGSITAGTDVITNSISKRPDGTHITIQNDVIMAAGLYVDGSITAATELITNSISKRPGGTQITMQNDVSIAGALQVNGAVSSTNLQIKNIASNDVTNNIWINSHVILNGRTALNDNVLVGGTLTVSNGNDLKVDGDVVVGADVVTNSISKKSTATHITMQNDVVIVGGLQINGNITGYNLNVTDIEAGGNVIIGADVVTNSISKKPGATYITMQDDVVIAGGLQVDGPITGYSLNVTDVTCTALFGNVINQLKVSLNPFWVAGKVDGTTLTKLASTGKYDFTVSRPGTNPTGAYKITFAMPAASAHYVITVNQQAAGVAKIWEYSAPTTTDCHLVTYNTSNVATNYTFYFSVFAGM